MLKALPERMPTSCADCLPCITSGGSCRLHPALPLSPDAVVSCFKLHAFAMLTLTWALPALLLRRLEQQVGWVGSGWLAHMD